MTKPFLQVVDLSVSYNAGNGQKKSVLSNLHIEIFPGEIVAIIGASGCGKTTFAMAVLNLLFPPAAIENGNIYYCGQDLLTLQPKQLNKIRWNEIAMVFQEPNSAFNPLRRVGPQISEALCLHEKLNKKTARARTLELLLSVNLNDAERLFSAYPHQLSAGMLQRALVAMATACQPKIIIADEPTSALDQENQQIILDLLLRKKDELNLSLILISHDIRLVAKFADRIAIMFEGRIVEIDKRSNVLANPKHHQTKTMLQASNRITDHESHPAVISDAAYT